MRKEAFENLNACQQCDVSCLVNSTIDAMVNDQFDFMRMTAFIELLKERIGQLDVVPKSMIESRHCSCGSAETNPQQQDVTSQTVSEQDALED